MKILQICPGAYQSGRGGISEHIKNISERLAITNDVTVYATNPDGKLPWTEVINNVKIIRFKRFAPSGSYFFSPSMLLNLRNDKYDIVHGHGYHAFPMHFSFLARSPKLFVTTHFHDSGHTPLRTCLLKILKPAGKIIFKKANRIIAVSEFEKKLLCDSLKIDEKKIKVIPNGTDFKEFSGLKRNISSQRSILYVGRLERYKGVQHLITVLPFLQPDVVLNIVGNGPLANSLLNQAKQLGVEKRVFFYNNLSRQKLVQMHIDADVFALLSEHESYSIVVAEALTAGTPCVILETSALKEWVDNEFCIGLSVPLRLEELKTKLIQAIENSGKKSSNTRVGKKILDWSEVVQQIINLYSE